MSLKKLRFGVICDSDTLPVWQANCLRGLITSEIAELSLSIIVKRDPTKPSLRNVIGEFLFSTYHKLFINRFSKALKPINIFREVIPKRIYCDLRKLKNGSQCLGQLDIEIIKDSGLDFLLLFISDDLSGEILTAAKYGVWGYRYYDSLNRQLVIPCYWEIYNNQVTTRVTLVKLTGQGQDCIVLYEGIFKTNLLSYRKSLDEVLFGSIDGCMRVCKEIIYGDIKGKKEKRLIANTKTKQVPNNLQFFGGIFILISNNLIHIWRKAFYLEIWNVGISIGRLNDIPNRSNFAHCKWLDLASKYQFLADPFCIKYNNTCTILVEDFDYLKSRKKAILSSIELKSGNVPDGITKCIIQPFHLSYPYLLERDGEIYCVPESNNANQVILFKSIKFPSVWEKHKVLIDNFPAVDSTIFEFNGRWWLFCTSQEHGHNTKLFCWYAEDLFGSWSPHKLNPLKCDVTSSRPAGKPFYIDGSLYRPSQNCSKNYGGAITFCRVIKLSPNEFEEEYVSTLHPDESGPYPDGLHTICNTEDITVIDGLKHRFYWNAGFIRLAQLIKGFYG